MSTNGSNGRRRPTSATSRKSPTAARASEQNPPAARSHGKHAPAKTRPGTRAPRNGSAAEPPGGAPLGGVPVGGVPVGGASVNGSNVIKIRISSDFTEGRDVQRRILDAVKHCAFDSQSEFAIKLALEEGLINAIKHGNKLDRGKHVRVEASVTPRQAEITIEDEGAGFTRSNVPDPTLEENLDKCSGRGILLIEAYMDRAEWTNRGRRLHMIKKNNA